MFDGIKQRYSKFCSVVKLEKIDQQDSKELKQVLSSSANKIMGISLICIASYFSLLRSSYFKNFNPMNIKDLKIHMMITGLGFTTMSVSGLLVMNSLFNVTDKLFEKYIGDQTTQDKIKEN